MGRFYHGDIHGKFMFAVQASDDPKFFIPSWSGFNEEDGLIEFLFKFDDLPNIKLGLATWVSLDDLEKSLMSSSTRLTATTMK